MAETKLILPISAACDYKTDKYRYDDSFDHSCSDDDDDDVSSIDDPIEDYENV